MKKFLPHVILGLTFLTLFWVFWSKAETEKFPLQRFSKIPVLAGGRVKPLDSVARMALFSIHGKQSLSISGERWSPIRWLIEVLANPKKADEQKIFLIQNPEVLGILRKTAEEKYFSFSEIQPFLDPITSYADSASATESTLRSHFQKDILNLRDRLWLYHCLKSSIQAEDTEDGLQELHQFESCIVPGMKVAKQQQQDALISKIPDDPALKELLYFVNRYHELAKITSFRVLPPPLSVIPSSESQSEDWATVGEGLLARIKTNALHPLILQWFHLILDFRNSDPIKFSEHLNVLESFFYTQYSSVMRHCVNEYHFNRLELFYVAMILYLFAFLVGLLAWMFWTQELQSTAFWLLVLALLIHSVGLVARMMLQGRPPITNLYSSAVYIGWASVLLGIFLEKIHKNGLGSLVSSLIGFSTLIIAHHLSFSGDTMEMMRAVLDSNFWLSTHVVCVTTGYSSTFVAGFLAVMAILKERFSKSFSIENHIAQMVYGVICFSLLFSFVGTVLGGIWADQSWGRFWGWDPKENGALLIVLWNVIILHARLGKYIHNRGLFVMAVFGNVVTSWSWFGVNMLGVGLHSYGFMDQAFFWLLAFVILQALIMLLGTFPKKVFKQTQGKLGKLL